LNIRSCRRRGPLRAGFTLIEVIGALVIFSVGVLMVLSLAGSLSRQMDWAAVTSELVVRAQERLDSLEAVPFSSLTPGSSEETLRIRGDTYASTVSVTSVTDLMYRLDVSIGPTDGADGPSYAVTSYQVSSW
jgi:prepilin-type N-terminal cleavage/methylation domain-containing protein